MSQDSKSDPKEERRRQILKGAKRLFIKGEFRDILLDDVAREAGVAKGTLYLYFKSKEDLLTGVMEDLEEQLDRMVKESGLDRLPRLEKFRALISVHLRFVELNRDFIFRYCEPLNLERSTGRAGAIERFIRHIRWVAGMIEDSVRTGELPPQDSFYSAVSLFSLVRGAFVERHLLGGDWPLESRTDKIYAQFMKGVLGQGGTS